MTLSKFFESCVWETEETMQETLKEMINVCSETNTFEIEVLKKFGHFQRRSVTPHPPRNLGCLASKCCPAGRCWRSMRDC